MRDRWCTCDPQRRNSDGSENGLCSFCEDAPFRDLLEAHAGGDPPTLDDLENDNGL